MSNMLVKFIIFLSFCVYLVSCGCRKQERNACESICRKDLRGKMTCELRGAIILPNMPNIEVSMPRVRKISRNCLLHFSVFDEKHRKAILSLQRDAKTNFKILKL